MNSYKTMSEQKEDEISYSKKLLLGIEAFTLLGACNVLEYGQKCADEVKQYIDKLKQLAVINHSIDVRKYFPKLETEKETRKVYNGKLGGK